MSYHPHRDSREDTPFRLILMRGLTIGVFAFVFLNMSGWNKAFNADKPMLTDQEIQAAHAFTKSIKDRAMALDERYTLTQFGADFSQIIGLTSALEKFAGSQLDHAPVITGTPKMVRLHEDVDNARENIVWLIARNQKLQHPGKEFDERVQMGAVYEYRTTHGGDPWPAFFRADPSPVPSINWRRVAKRGVDGWLLAMIPAGLTILLGFRLRRESLWAELVEQPKMLVGAIALWPLMLWGYDSQPGVIERKLRRLIDAYWNEHHAQPSQEWEAGQRLVLMRRARDVQHGLAQIAEYPELIRVNSRSAILASWIFAMASGPLSLMFGVVQAYANVARVNGGIDSTQVDSSRVQRRRETSGKVFGIMDYTRERGFNLGTILGTAHLHEGRVSADAWADLKTPQVLQASATVSITDHVGIEAGRIWSPVGFCLPTPDIGLFPGGSLGSYFPAGIGDGVAVHVDAPHSMLVASAQSGLDPTRTDFDGYAKHTQGPVTVQAGGHTGSEQFAFGEIEIASHGVLLREMAVTRPDRNRAAIGTDIVYRTGMYRGGIHLEHGRWQATLERKFSTFSRFVLHLGQLSGVTGTAVTAKVQYGLALAQ